MDAVAGIDLGLAMKRQMIVELGDHDVGKECRSGPAAGNGVVRCRGLDHRLAIPAGEGLADVPHDLEAARHIVEGLGDVGADPAQSTAALRAGTCHRVDDLLARQMVRQRPACRLDLLDLGLDHRCHGRDRGHSLGVVRLQRFDR